MNFRYARARTDVFDLADWYDAQRVGLGDELELEVQRGIDRIVANPRVGGRVPRSPGGREVRQLAIDRFTVVLTYEVTPTDAVILSVIHGRSIRRSWRRRLPDPPTR